MVAMRVPIPVLDRRRLVQGLAAAIGCTVVGAARSASAHTASSETLVCPVDATKLQVSVTMSMTTFGAFRDFQKKGAIGSYYEDLVHACSTCKFAGFGGDFAKPVAPETKKWVLGELKKKWAGRTPSQAEECEIAAERYQLERAKNETIGNLYLFGSYLLRTATGPVALQRKGYQRSAAKFFLQAMAAGEIQSDARGPVTYLVAEMERRVGDHKAAIAHYDAAAAEPTSPDWLKPMITEQRALAAKGDANNGI